MSLLFRERRAASFSLPARGVATGPITTPTQDQALRHSAVWACVNLIADMISPLPIDRYQRVDGVAVAKTDTTIVEDPGVGIDRISWIRQVLVSWLSSGNVFLLPTEYTASMYPRRAVVVDPMRVRCKLPQHGIGTVDWFVDGKPVPELIHRPAFAVPGSPIGLSPIGQAAASVGLGLNAQEFGARWFLDGGHPSGMLTNDGVITPDDAEVAKRRFLASIRGTREPLVIGKGWKWTPVSVPADESQFLETMQANVADVARYFGLRAEDIGGSSGDSMTYANVEQRSLDRLTYPIATWVAKLDELLTSLTPRPQYVKVNVDALVRVDLETRYKAHDLAITSGMASPDERRKLEDLAPIPDGAGAHYVWPPHLTAPTANGATP